MVTRCVTKGHAVQRAGGGVGGADMQTGVAWRRHVQGKADREIISAAAEPYHVAGCKVSLKACRPEQLLRAVGSCKPVTSSADRSYLGPTLLLCISPCGAHWMLCCLGCCTVCCTQGAQLIELLKKNPAVAIPVIIIRLEQKEAEWLKVNWGLGLHVAMGSMQVVAVVLLC